MLNTMNMLNASVADTVQSPESMFDVMHLMTPIAADITQATATTCQEQKTYTFRPGIK